MPGALDGPDGNGNGTIGLMLGGCLWTVLCVAVFIGINSALVWAVTQWAQWVVMEPDAEVAPVVYAIGGVGLLVYQGITVFWIVLGVNKMITKD